MKKLVKWSVVLVVLSLVGIAITDAQDSFSVAMISEDPTVPGHTFTKSAWEGLVAFGEENEIEEGESGYHLYASISEADYFTNFVNAIEGDFDLIIGLGSQTQTALDEFALANENQQFALVDGAVDHPNVASLVFKDHEAAYLAGIATALETQTNQVGFVGGAENATIQAFEQGFIAGVHEIDSEIDV